MARTPDTARVAAKREREKRMVSEMIALYCRKKHGTRGGELGIALRHSGTVYDRVRSGRALGRMAADKRNAAGFQLGGTLVSAKVAAGNGKSCRQQAGSQRAHADAAHSNEINFLLFRPKFPLHGINIC